MKPVYTGTMLIVIIVITVLVFGTTFSKNAEDCDKLMEQSQSIVNSQNANLAELAEHKPPISEETGTKFLESAEKLRNAQSKLDVEWKTNCS